MPAISPMFSNTYSCTRALVYLAKKDAALRFIDTHAGAGRYDLASVAAERSPEWRDGIARLIRAKPPEGRRRSARPLSRGGRAACDEAEGRPLSYPGSPAIAQAMLRPQDRIALCEAHPEEREKLIAALGHDARLNIVATDGYIALNAYVPPKERRGLVLIDPPVRIARRNRRVSRTALRKALGKWPRGTYMLWRPIKDDRADRRFLRAIADFGVAGMLRIEIDVGAIPPGPHSPDPLRRIGLLFVNPPYPLYDEARLLTALSEQTADPRRRAPASSAEWLTPPA